jgi:hypothetical protein
MRILTPAGYSGTPLVKKLGIAPASTLALVGAPGDFREELVGLPDDVRIVSRASPRAELTIWFVRRRAELDAGISRMSATMGSGLWMAWPKKASGVATDLTEDVIRAAGLAHGLVDYKVCAITHIWSGLKFARRKKS